MTRGQCKTLAFLTRSLFKLPRRKKLARERPFLGR
jgi:hypothetical protein